MKKLFICTRMRNYIIALILVMLVLGLCPFTTPLIASADSRASNVLDDLKKDSSFDISHYPIVADDYSLKLIQIAESTDNELLLYVYQPSGQAKNLTASSINISTTINDDISFHNFKLQFLNSDGVFYKYLVKDFVVRSAPTRYYAISSIFRPYDETIDSPAEHGNIVTEVEYAVNKQYAISIINGQPYCNVVDIETIVITDKFVGFVRYSDGFKLYPTACDSHFVAFNTDKPIDKLLEADVYYTKQHHVTFNNASGTTTERFDDKTDEYAYLTYTDKVEHTGGGLWAGTYKWDRIETVEQFIAENDLTQNVYSGAIIDVSVANRITDEGKAALQGKKWVLRFVETDVYTASHMGASRISTDIVGDVTILRLKFETDGITYNLGVIDNKQSGSDKPVNEEELNIKLKDSLPDWVKLLLLILGIILGLVLLSLILPYILPVIVWLIALPFKVIAALFKGIKNTVSSSKKRKEKRSNRNGGRSSKKSKQHRRK